MTKFQKIKRQGTCIKRNRWGKKMKRMREKEKKRKRYVKKEPPINEYELKFKSVDENL